MENYVVTFMDVYEDLCEKMACMEEDLRSLGVQLPQFNLRYTLMISLSKR